MITKINLLPQSYDYSPNENVNYRDDYDDDDYDDPYDDDYRY